MDEQDVVGRVLRANTRGFACGTHSSRIDEKHSFGAFVKAPITNDPTTHAIGLIYSVEIKDDQLINELVMAAGVDGNVLRDQRENRMVPVEISVLSVGYQNGAGEMVYSLPPRPPLSLSEVVICHADEVYAFARRPDFFRLVLNAAEVPADDLLAAAILYGAWVCDEAERDGYLVECGRQLARLLSGDLKRLEHILALIRTG